MSTEFSGKVTNEAWMQVPGMNFSAQIVIQNLSASNSLLVKAGETGALPDPSDHSGIIVEPAKHRTFLSDVASEVIYVRSRSSSPVLFFAWS